MACSCRKLPFFERQEPKCHYLKAFSLDCSLSTEENSDIYLKYKLRSCVVKTRWWDGVRRRLCHSFLPFSPQNLPLCSHNPCFWWSTSALACTLILEFLAQFFQTAYFLSPGGTEERLGPGTGGW